MKAIIIDDKKRQIDYLEFIIEENCKTLEIVGKFQSPIEALKFLGSNSTDIIFLDVEMPEMTGFEFIEIVGLDNLPAIIFTTAHSKYAVSAFKVNAIDYLLKPIDPNDLKRAVNRAAIADQINAMSKLNNLIENPPKTFDSRLTLCSGQTYSFVLLQDIIYIKSDGGYSTFFMKNNRTATTSKWLNNYWKRLEGHNFIRPHQSYVVNIAHVLTFNKSDGGELILTEDHHIPVSSRMKDAVKNKLGLN